MAGKEFPRKDRHCLPILCHINYGSYVMGPGFKGPPKELCEGLPLLSTHRVRTVDGITNGVRA